MRVFILLAVFYAAVAAVPFKAPRIVGGDVTTIENYPSMVVILGSFDSVNFSQFCGGTIINQRSVLTAAHCFDVPATIRARVGSTYANSGGILYNIQRIFIHPEYRVDHDIAVMRVAGHFVYSNVVHRASIAGPNYPLGDNEEVWAAGWGNIADMGPRFEELRHVQVWTINQDVCRQRYSNDIGDNYLCTGWLDVGGRDQCQGDSGGPVFHHGVVVGVTHGGAECGSPIFPGLNMRVSFYSKWIEDNA
ncbi:trypsin, alkaline C-like [Anticarsia gemmatalis]|uniref:trypsin, alkaline C-like n=1 Tax=Anticarsia gemmatalis TaxID=129554 RepID=UPI003F76803B